MAPSAEVASRFIANSPWIDCALNAERVGANDVRSHRYLLAIGSLGFVSRAARAARAAVRAGDTAVSPIWTARLL